MPFFWLSIVARHLQKSEAVEGPQIPVCPGVAGKPSVGESLVADKRLAAAAAASNIEAVPAAAASSIEAGIAVGAVAGCSTLDEVAEHIAAGQRSPLEVQKCIRRPLADQASSERRQVVAWWASVPFLGPPPHTGRHSRREAPLLSVAVSQPVCKKEKNDVNRNKGKESAKDDEWRKFTHTQSEERAMRRSAAADATKTTPRRGLDAIFSKGRWL